MDTLREHLYSQIVLSFMAKQDRHAVENLIIFFLFPENLIIGQQLEMRLARVSCDTAPVCPPLRPNKGALFYIERQPLVRCRKLHDIKLNQLIKTHHGICGYFDRFVAESGECQLYI